jgi:hypothetical protein
MLNEASEDEDYDQDQDQDQEEDEEQDEGLRVTPHGIAARKHVRS